MIYTSLPKVLNVWRTIHNNVMFFAWFYAAITFGLHKLLRDTAPEAFLACLFVIIVTAIINLVLFSREDRS